MNSVLRISLMLFLLCCTASWLAAQEIPQTPPPLNPDQGLIQIVPEVDCVQLQQTTQSQNLSGPWISAGTLNISVRSPLPEWGVILESVQLQGPGGALPADRIWIRTEATEGNFVPLTAPVPVVWGNLRKPATKTSVELEVRPSWQDPPGDYRGTLNLRPLDSMQSRQEQERMRKSQPAASGEQMSPQKSPGTSSTAASEMPFARQVSLSFKVPELIVLSVSGQQLQFEGIGGEGTYRANQNVRFRVMTNARAWRVVCNAGNLKGERGEIPAERIKWERVNELGRVLNDGNLGLNATILSSGDAGVSPDEEIIMRFAIDVTMADVAGSYSGSISLQGITGQ